MTHLCLCGCGKEVKEGRRYAGPGHDARVNNSFKGKHHTKESIEKQLITKRNGGLKPQLCECGCGEMTKKGRRFLQGHNLDRDKEPWNKNLTKETSKKVKEATEKSGKTLQIRYDNGEIDGYWRGKKRPNLWSGCREELVGVHLSPLTEFKKGQVPHNKGKNHSKETKKKQRISALKRLKRQLGDGFPSAVSIGKNEKPILDNLENALGFKIFRQYETIGYFLDGYIPCLHLAFEIDEFRHFDSEGNLKERDKIRQNEIEEELGCQFVRIKV